jgi:AcrR family transcriptional regulator
MQNDDQHMPGCRPGRRGRPRCFDQGAALDAAMRVFWERGYASASIAELTAAMGINPPSLYAAFGDKQRLFLAALDRYQGEVERLLDAALARPGGRKARLHAALRQMAREMIRPGRPAGCMLVLSGLHCGEAGQSLEQQVAERRRGVEQRLRAHLQDAAAGGELAGSGAPARLARFYASVLMGLSIQARGGASQRALLQVVDDAMAAWPGPPSSPP